MKNALAIVAAIAGLGAVTSLGKDLDKTHSRPHPLFLSYVEQCGRHPSERLDFVDVGAAR